MAEQHREVERCQEQVEQITAGTHAVLAIADQLASVAIETPVTKGDLEVGIEPSAASGKL
ncbi:hypothetical protein ACTMTI_52175 [Nonomuraea sp. H19]|uniref:hypothetical protein n=1 Tax=Nonomuraea sp. H19 TaxID=3452206 RepID=UPI003F8C54B8